MAKKNETACCDAAVEQDETDAHERTLTLTGEEAEDWDEFVGVKAALSMMSLVVDNDGCLAASDRWREVWEKLSSEQMAEAAYFLTNAGGSATSKLSGNPRDRLLLASALWLIPEEVRQAPKSSDTVTTLQATGTDG